MHDSTILQLSNLIYHRLCSLILQDDDYILDKIVAHIHLRGKLLQPSDPFSVNVNVTGFSLADVSEPEPKTCITMEEWIDVWGTIVGKAKRMDDFPMWLQYYPKVLFDIINRSGMEQPTICCKSIILTYLGTGVISKSELHYFYTAFMDVGKLGGDKLEEITKNAYEALTSVSWKCIFWVMAHKLIS